MRHQKRSGTAAVGGFDAVELLLPPWFQAIRSFTLDWKDFARLRQGIASATAWPCLLLDIKVLWHEAIGLHLVTPLADEDGNEITADLTGLGDPRGVIRAAPGRITLWIPFSLGQKEPINGRIVTTGDFPLITDVRFGDIVETRMSLVDEVTEAGKAEGVVTGSPPVVLLTARMGRDHRHARIELPETPITEAEGEERIHDIVAIAHRESEMDRLTLAVASVPVVKGLLAKRG